MFWQQNKVRQVIDTNKAGQDAENFACKWLQNKKLTLVQENFACKLGEIDLIMQHSDTLVFIEVRLRKNNHYGSAAESVTSTKQKKLIKTAQLYLQRFTSQAMPICRFDVIALQKTTKTWEVNWIQSAFELQ